MLKKKNIAMVMAATTVATSVAPVFAAGTQDVDQDTMIAEVERLLDTKYTDAKDNGLGSNIDPGDEYTNSVYSITANAATASAITNVPVKNIDQLKDLIEKAAIENKTLTLTIVDKGHEVLENGDIVSTVTNKNTFYTTSAGLESVTTGSCATTGVITGVTQYDVNDTTSPASGSVDRIEVELINGTKIELNKSSYQLNFNKGLDEDGNVIDLSSAAGVTDPAVMRKVVGFEKINNAPLATKDIPSNTITHLALTGNVLVNADFADLKTEGYTQKGADIVNFVIEAKKDALSPSVQGTIVKDGKKYNVGNYIPGNVEAVKEGGYKFTFGVTVLETGATVGAPNNVTIVIKGSSQDELTKFKTYLGSVTNKIVPGNVTTLAGENRFETAVAVSKETFVGKNENTGNNAGAIVLVGENAVVDGLAAAPLAAQEDAPILLTKKDSVPEETMTEIKRIVAKGSDIYLIGGENTISKEVESILIDEMNANIIRVSGKDRYETSIEIAEKITTPNARAFVVGGDGLADAMSIAAVAARDTNGPTAGKIVSPIIVTPKDGLTKDATNYLTNASITSVDVVGGENNVSRDVLKDIVAITKFATNTERVAGKDRQETNAKVISKYFFTEGKNGATTKALEHVYVAKDGYVGGDAQLIDALAVAPLAASQDGAVVLATNDLTKEQQTAVGTAMVTTAKTLTQAGNGIAETIISKLVKLLGL